MITSILLAVNIAIVQCAIEYPHNNGGTIVWSETDNSDGLAVLNKYHSLELQCRHKCKVIECKIVDHFPSKEESENISKQYGF